ncbi:MAG: PDZ domain-containing protein [Mucilaginibacter sp.]
MLFLKKYLLSAGICCLLCCFFTTARGQYFSLNSNVNRVKIPFKLIRNLVIVQLKINKAGPYNFIMDTGVGIMIITDPSLVDSISIPDKRTITVSGLGAGDSYEAYITGPLNVNIQGITSTQVSAAILKKDPFGLSGYAGIPIHGLLGFEFFNKLAVKVNFSDSLITVMRSQHLRRFKKGIKIPLMIEANKPYMTATVTLSDGTKQERKVIVDLGAGHALSLENVPDKSIYSSNFIKANLGIGLNGLISGYKGRVKVVKLGKYKLNNVLTAFPDDDTRALRVKRDGNIGVDILKKFTLIFDYADSALFIKPAFGFKEPFEHDMSGLQYYAAGDGYKHVIVDSVEPGSPADEAGICRNDEITAINFKPVADMDLEQIDQLFKSKNNRSILLDIYRNKARERVIITLKRRI